MCFDGAFLNLFIKQLKREFLIQFRQLRILINSCLFFLMILFFFPLTLNPEPELIKLVAPGLIWMALLLSILLSAERLFTQDFEQGVLEQWLISGQALNVMVSAKISAHWVLNTGPVLLLCPLAGLIFSLSPYELLILIIGLLCGTPALFALCALAASFGLGVNQKGVLMALILFPLTLPILIFGSGVVHLAMNAMPVAGHCALLLAFSILAWGLLPFAIAAILRINHNE
ncbi:MAG: heme exporter protein CcmB [Legionella sp.]|nr:MAG: heme exporter protein CcmB [Legionella sp.]PJD99602.1 MAG: heme exporter protein CcmB [Legionella sp.]